MSNEISQTHLLCRLEKHIPQHWSPEPLHVPAVTAPLAPLPDGSSPRKAALPWLERPLRARVSQGQVWLNLTWLSAV